MGVDIFQEFLRGDLIQWAFLGFGFGGGFGGIGKIFKGAGKAAGSILKAPASIFGAFMDVPEVGKAPEPEPPEVMPDPDDELEKRRRLAMVTRSSQGRLASIFTGTKLGG